MTRRRNRSLLQKLIISHMLVLTLVFAVTGTFYFLTSIKLTREETVITGTNTITEGKNVVDTSVSAVLSLGIPLITKDNVQQLGMLARPFPTDSHVELNNTRSSLGVYSMMNDFANSLTLYYKATDLFVSDKSVGVYPKAFFYTQMAYCDMSYEGWKYIVNGKNQYRVMSNYKSAKPSRVDIIHDLPLQYRHDEIAMIVSIDGKAFETVFEQLLQHSGSYLFVRGTNGDIFYSNADPAEGKELLKYAESDSGEFLVFSARSNVVDFEYVALIPQKALYSREYRFIGNFIFVYFLLMLFFYMLFIFISYNNTKPLKRVMNYIAQKQGIAIGKNENEVEIIGTAFSDLLYGAENMAMTIQEIFLSKLLNGLTFTEDEVMSINSYFGEIFHYDKYQVAVFKITETDRAHSSEEYILVNTMQKIAYKQINSTLPENVFAHAMDYDKIVLIFCLKNDAPDDAPAEVINQYMEDLRGMKIHAICSIGDQKELSDQIYISFQNACWLLQTADICAEADAKSVYWCADKSVEYNSFYYPDEFQQRFANLVLTGESAAATAELAKLCKINLHIKKLSNREKSYFTNTICNELLVLKKAVGLFDDKEEDQFHYIMSQAYNNPYYESNEAYFNMLVGVLSGYAKRKKSERENTVLEHIFNYVNENFDDPELGVASIAHNLDMAENYISTFFKQNKNENLSAYIERIRLDTAVQYITGRQLSIKEISVKVGYANLNTFYKAFKRRFGIPPKQYQQNIISSAAEDEEAIGN